MIKGSERIIKKPMELTSGIWLSVATCFMLFLYAPLELLFTNQDEFWFDAYILVPIMFAVFCLICVISILVLALLIKLNEKVYWLGIMLYFIFFIGLYFQGNFLAGGLPSLDGGTIDWSLYSSERMKSVILWIIVSGVIFFPFWRLERRVFASLVRVVCICMTLMFCVTLTTLALTNQGFAKKPSMSMTTKNMFRMSNDTNFIILMLDAVDGQAMAELLQINPEYENIFTDFTFYNNVVAAYPYTKHSIPYIFSGEWFENETEFREYEVEAYASSPFLSTMEERGYCMSVYDEELLLNDEGMGRFENMLSNKRGIDDKWAFVRWQMLMVAFKYAPYDLKRFSFVNPNAFNNLKIVPDGETLFDPTNAAFYDLLINEEISYTEQKCFKFIHIGGGHVPFIYNENVEVIPEESGTYEDNLKACLTIVREYLSELSESDVYDNSVIIVMSDHGYNWLDAHGRQNPIMFVKGIDEKHDFSISDAPISFEDLQEAYQRLLDGANSDQIFDWESGTQRERRFLFHEYLKEDYMVEYMQPGMAHDTEAMYETGNVYSR